MRWSLFAIQASAMSCLSNCVSNHWVTTPFKLGKSPLATIIIENIKRENRMLRSSYLSEYRRIG
jgi:hypothetical protein